MGLRAYSETLGRIDNTAYRMNIYDKNYSDAAMTFDTGPNFFSLQYDQKDDKIFEPIMGSVVDFQILVENSALETLINDIATAYEDRFVLEIIRENSRYWIGKIVSDDISIPDENPNFFASLSATDGIGMLKGIKYLKSDGTLYDEKQNFITILNNVLTKISYVIQFYRTGDIFLKTHMRFFEKYHEYDDTNSDADPLLNTRVHTDFTVKETSNDNYDVIDCYQVLENVCKRFKMQLKMVDGYFYVTQPLQQATQLTIHNYDIYASHLSQTIEDHSKSFIIDNLRSDGVYNFYPPILYAEEQFKARTSIYKYNLLPYPLSYINQAYNLGTLSTSNDNYLVLKSNTGVFVDSPPQGTTELYVFYKLKIKVGNYYVKYENGNYQFVDDSSARVSFNIELSQDPQNQGWWNGSKVLNFTTDPIPIEDTGIYELSLDKIENENGELFYNVDYDYVSTSAEHVLRNGLLSSKSITFRAYNQESGNNIEATKSYDLGEVLIGDRSGDLITHATGMIEYNSFQEWRKANSWQIEQEGQNVNISRLGVREVARAFYSPLQNYSAIFRSSAFTPLTYGALHGYEWIFNGGTFDAKRGQWDANFIWINPTDNSVDSVIVNLEEPAYSPSPSNQQIEDTVKEVETVKEQDTKAVTPLDKDFQISKNLLYPNSPSGTDDQNLMTFDSSDNKVKRQTNYLHTLNLKLLTAAEVNQLRNIDTTTLSVTQWGYLGELDQSLKKSASVEFNKIAHGAQFVNVRQIASGNATLNDNDYLIVYTDTNSGDTFTVSGAVGRIVIVVNNSSTNTLDMKDDSATINGGSVITISVDASITIIKIDSGKWVQTSKY